VLNNLLHLLALLLACSFDWQQQFQTILWLAIECFAIGIVVPLKQAGSQRVFDTPQHHVVSILILLHFPFEVTIELTVHHLVLLVVRTLHHINIAVDDVLAQLSQVLLFRGVQRILRC
jgi:hypothetical protein